MHLPSGRLTFVIILRSVVQQPGSLHISSSRLLSQHPIYRTVAAYVADAPINPAPSAGRVHEQVLPTAAVAHALHALRHLL